MFRLMPLQANLASFVQVRVVRAVFGHDFIAVLIAYAHLYLLLH